MSSELEIAVADSVAAPERAAAAKRRRRRAGRCHNCGAELQGHFCHVCGQNADTHKRSIRHLIWEAIETTFELDGRLFRTVPALFFRPGTLARDYIDGRIVRHVPPFRTFLVALLLFIFAAEHATHEQTAGPAAPDGRARAPCWPRPQGRAAEVARIRAGSRQGPGRRPEGSRRRPRRRPEGPRREARQGRSVLRAPCEDAQDRYARRSPAPTASPRACRETDEPPAADLVVNGKQKAPGLVQARASRRRWPIRTTTGRWSSAGPSAWR